MKQWKFGLGALLAAALATAVLGVARADDDEEESGRRGIAMDPTYSEECGACHVAFPPGLLSRQSWQAVMGGLTEHFGTDASLDAATAARIDAYLQASAGRRETRGADGRPLLRITETGWFRREHRPGEHGMTRTVFDSTEVGSAANCQACHRGAAEGRYGEREIRLPRIAAARSQN